MTPDNDAISMQLPVYVARSQEYLRNAYASLEQNEVEKAGEFLWGSMAQAIKAVAAFKNVQLRTHGEIWKYMTALSKDTGDSDIFDAFKDANSLHSNFYESGLTREMVLTMEQRIRHTVGKLVDMIPREALEQ